MFVLSRNIKILRQRDGISQRELAKDINVSGQYIAKIEKNERTPSLENIIKITNYFNVDLEKLIRGEF